MDKRQVELAENQIYDLRKTVRYDIRELTIEIIVNKYQKGRDYDPEMDKAEQSKFFSSLWIPEYQRDFTWDEQRQSRFIESVLLGLPIPLIFVAENENSVWEIVDGSQRIRTLNAFMNNKLVLQDLEKLNTLNGFRFADLDPSRQGKFKDLPIRMIVLTEEATDEVKKDMFERINRGSDLLKPMEKRKGIYIGPFNSFIYQQCAKNPLFIKLAPIDHWLEKRQEREELILRFFAFAEHYDKFPYGKGIAKFLDEYLDKMNKMLTSKDAMEQSKFLTRRYAEFESVLSFVNESSKYGFRRRHNPQTKRVIFEAISVGVLLALKQKPNLTCSKEKMDNILNSKAFDEYTMGNVGNKRAYSPDQIMGRILYIRDSLLK